MVRKTTSLKVEEEVWKKFKVKCILDGRDISDEIEDLIKGALKK
jgi:hypothetical protein